MTLTANQPVANKQRKFLRELEVLLLCATTEMDSHAVNHLQKLLSEKIDWDVLVSMGHRHGTMPLLHKQLATHARENVPQEIAEKLRTQAKAKGKQNFILASELVRLKELLDSLNVDFIPLKGPCLAVDAYGSLSLRVFADLDIIVRGVDVPRVHVALEEAGYEPGPLKTRLTTQFMQSELFRRLTPEQSYTRGAQGGGYSSFVVDLHWRLEPPFFDSIDFSNLLANTVEIEVCGQQVRKLNPELELVYLCLHATRNQWKQIRFLVDIEQIVRKNPNLDWRNMYDFARSLGAERQVDMALALCRRALRMQLPKLPELKKNEIENSDLLKKLADVTEDEWSWSEPRPYTLRY
ncbi:MAG TPA: nucleotidyltransferase family protein, partial [Trichormus sp.]